MRTRAARTRRREDDSVRFDFAPMVDVVLLLVIFFMLTSSLTRHNVVPLDLPRASSTVRDTPEIPTVSVDQAGTVYLDGATVDIMELETRLRPLADASGGVVALRADEQGNYGRVVEVMDAIHREGGERLALGQRQE